MKSNPKNNSKHSLYFVASPRMPSDEELSAKTTPAQSPYLKAILSGKTRPISQPRIKPMITPYRENVKHDSVKTPFQRIINGSSKLPKDTDEIK